MQSQVSNFTGMNLYVRVRGSSSSVEARWTPSKICQSTRESLKDTVCTCSMVNGSIVVSLCKPRRLLFMKFNASTAREAAGESGHPKNLMAEPFSQT